MKLSLNLILLICITFTSSAQNCPSITVSTTIEYTITESDTLSFTAELNPDTNQVTFNWAISAGTIESGQGTRTIKVLTSELAGMTITATVDVGGFSRNCMTSASATVEVLKGPEKIISANYTTAPALTADIKKFIKQTDLSNVTITQTAFVFVYSGTTTTAAQLKAMKAAIAKEFEKNGIFDFQYKIADGGKRKTASIEIFKLLPGAPEPKSSQNP